MRSYLRTIDGQEYWFGEEWSPTECFHCGICCIDYQPKLAVSEVKFIAERLSMGVDEFINNYVTVTQVGYLMRQAEGGCVFLRWEQGTSRTHCSIYSIRPEVCRNWVSSLSRPQCREGLSKLQTDNRVLLVGDVYQNQEQLERFYTLLGQFQK